MDKREHARLLREAIESQGADRQQIAEAVSRSYRTIGNWTSTSDPTAPTAAERMILRNLLGPYDSPGDAVERAVRNSELDEWRRDSVIAFYKRNLHEQGREQGLSAATPSLRGVAKPGGLEPEDGDLNEP